MEGLDTVDVQFTSALVRLLIFLPLVLGLAYLAARCLSSWRFRWQRHASYLEVVEHLALGPRVGLYVVRVGSRYCLFAVTQGGLDLVKELEDYPLATSGKSSAWPLLPWCRDWGFMGRKTRKGGEGHAP